MHKNAVSSAWKISGAICNLSCRQIYICMNLGKKKSTFPTERESLLGTQIYFTLDHTSNHSTSAISLFNLEPRVQEFEVMCRKEGR